jgi:hypothetical protein
MIATNVTVELLGMARHRSGRSELTVPGHTVADIAHGVVMACPALAGIISAEGVLSRHYLFCLDGGPFIDDPTITIPAGCRLVIFGADAGG